MTPVDFATQPTEYLQVTPTRPKPNRGYIYTVPVNTVCQLVAFYVDYIAAIAVHAFNVQTRIEYYSSKTLCLVIHSWGPTPGSMTELAFAIDLAYTRNPPAAKAGREHLPDCLYLYPGDQIILSMHNHAYGDQFWRISLLLRTWILA